MKKLSLLLMLTMLFATSKAQTAGENIDVEHYSIHIYELDFANRTLQGETFVYLRATTDVSQIVLELKSLEVSAVTSTTVLVSGFSQNGD